MNKDVLAQLKQRILMGLEHVSKGSYRYRNSDFDTFLNAYLVLSVKLNHSLIGEYAAILKSIPHQMDKPNVVNVTNGLSQLGYLTKRRSGCKNLDKLTFPCFITKGTLIDHEVRVLFRENNAIISYNPEITHTPFSISGL